MHRHPGQAATTAKRLRDVLAADREQCRRAVDSTKCGRRSEAAMRRPLSRAKQPQGEGRNRADGGRWCWGAGGLGGLGRRSGEGGLGTEVVTYEGRGMMQLRDRAGGEFVCTAQGGQAAHLLLPPGRVQASGSGRLALRPTRVPHFLRLARPPAANRRSWVRLLGGRIVRRSRSGCHRCRRGRCHVLPSHWPRAACGMTSSPSGTSLVPPAGQSRPRRLCDHALCAWKLGEGITDLQGLTFLPRTSNMHSSRVENCLVPAAAIHKS